MKYILFILVFVIVGCSIFENNDTEKKRKQKPATQVVIKGETQLEKYARLRAENNKNLKSNLPSEQAKKIKNEVKRITLKLLSKLDVLDGNKSIIIEPITIADKMPSKFTEVRNQIEFLLINEMFEFGIPVMDYSRKNKGSDLILQSHLSLYQESYILSTFVKSRASGEIKSAAQIPLDNNLLEQLKDGVRVLK
ncbi:hypothetical protein KO527_10010 [Pseudoalteromonas sp. C2R02]|uniref:hypothetical protein n=1 Tax=Pseudoalteromonas sp. C2R02 TaxID=2841565 RepID=UPI001C07F824|nr:hypothetical protein [Pseudoalteromonas sp. C2R02]MBU2969680.1 hypothetical protein [Pseudoalteromonas sp. C2R02]